jgi:hypothetical protein
MNEEIRAAREECLMLMRIWHDCERRLSYVDSHYNWSLKNGHEPDAFLVGAEQEKRDISREKYIDSCHVLNNLERIELESRKKKEEEIAQKKRENLQKKREVQMKRQESGVSLDPKERMGEIYRRRLEGKTYKEIGEEFCFSKSNVEKIVKLAHEKIQKIMSRDILNTPSGLPKDVELAHGIWHTFSWEDKPEPVWKMEVR